MEEPGKATEAKKPMTTVVLYGILIIIVALVVVVLIAKYVFNVDLLNFDEVSGFINRFGTVRRAR